MRLRSLITWRLAAIALFSVSATTIPAFSEDGAKTPTAAQGEQKPATTATAEKEKDKSEDKRETPTPSATKEGTQPAEGNKAAEDSALLREIHKDLKQTKENVTKLLPLHNDVELLKNDVLLLKKDVLKIQSDLRVTPSGISAASSFRSPLSTPRPSASTRSFANASADQRASIAKSNRRLFSRAGVTGATAIAHAASASGVQFPQRVTTPARRVHFLIFSFTTDFRKDEKGNEIGIGLGAQANHQFLTSLATSLQSAFPANEQDRINLKQRQTFTKADLQAVVNEVANEVQPDDTVFCYLSTHGAFAQDGTGHFFDTSDGQQIRRSDVFNLLKKLNADLTVLVSDSCAVLRDAGPQRAFAAAPAGDPTTYAILDLLFNFEGDLNINGCTVAEEGIYLVQPGRTGGGFATRAFMEVAVYGDSSEGWAGFFEQLKTEVTAETTSFNRKVPTNQQAPFQIPSLFDAVGQPVQ